MSEPTPEEIDRTLKEKGMHLTCIHVLNKELHAEYNKEDDGYICTPCRDTMEKLHEDSKEIMEFAMKNFHFVHKECLGI